MMADGHFKFVIDLQEVTYFIEFRDAHLINSQKNANSINGGEIYLANVSGKILSSLELAGFDQLFTFFDDLSPQSENSKRMVE